MVGYRRGGRMAWRRLGEDEAATIFHLVCEHANARAKSRRKRGHRHHIMLRWAHGASRLHLRRSSSVEAAYHRQVKWRRQPAALALRAGIPPPGGEAGLLAPGQPASQTHPPGPSLAGSAELLDDAKL